MAILAPAGAPLLIVALLRLALQRR